MLSGHQCFTGESGRRGWEPIVLQRDPFLTKRKMVSDDKMLESTPFGVVADCACLSIQYLYPLHRLSSICW